MPKKIDKDIAIVLDELESHGYTIGRLLRSKLMEISARLQDESKENSINDSVKSSMQRIE